MTTSRSEEKRGSDCTGGDGATNRTFTLGYGGYVVGSLVIYRQGAYLYEIQDYTISGNVITFSVEIYNADFIDFRYFTSDGTGLASGSSSYATTLQFVKILGIKGDIPMWDVGSSPTRETVGVGDGSTTTFYFDHRNVIATTYTLYYGTTAATTTTLTETTHYTIDKTKGKITLTGAGVTLVSTNNIYAEYSYCTFDVSDEYLADVLARAQAEVDSELNSSFTDGTSTNPQYPSITEYLESKGQYDLTYFTSNGPLKDISTTLNEVLDTTETSIDVAAGDGSLLPSSGTIIIDEEIITYTGISTDTLTGCTRGALGSTAATHATGAAVHTTVVSISGTGEGTTPSWTPLAWESDMFAEDVGVGKIYIYDTQMTSNVSSVNASLLAKIDVPNRFRVFYLYGYDTIPYDITRLTLLLAKRMLVQDNIGASIFKGRNEFGPSISDISQIDTEEIRRIMDSYRIPQMGNV